MEIRVYFRVGTQLCFGLVPLPGAAFAIAMTASGFVSGFVSEIVFGIVFGVVFAIVFGIFAR